MKSNPSPQPSLKIIIMHWNTLRNAIQEVSSTLHKVLVLELNLMKENLDREKEESALVRGKDDNAVVDVSAAVTEAEKGDKEICTYIKSCFALGPTEESSQHLDSVLRNIEEKGMASQVDITKLTLGNSFALRGMSMKITAMGNTLDTLTNFMKNNAAINNNISEQNQILMTPKISKQIQSERERALRIWKHCSFDFYNVIY